MFAKLNDVQIKLAVSELPFPLSNNHQVELLLGEHIYFIEENEEVIGYLSVTFMKADGEIKFANICGLSVDQRYQNNGIATALLRKALSIIEQGKILAVPMSEAADHILSRAC